MDWKDNEDVGVDYGPEGDDDAPADAESIRCRLDELYVEREALDNQLARLTADIDNVDDEIADLESTLEQLEE